MATPVEEYKKKATSFSKANAKCETIVAKIKDESQAAEKGGVSGAKAVENLRKLVKEHEKAMQVRDKAHAEMSKALEKM